MISDRWPYSYEPDETLPESPDRSPSPRTDLLSPDYDRALERPTLRRRSTPRGPNDRFRRERERIHSGSSKRDLVKALISEEYESKQTRRVLYKAYDQFQNETRRATDAEGRALEAAQRYRSLNESKVAAQQEAARLREELRLYKLQLENAQSEILKAQDVLKVVEEQRDDAEAAAARARDTARKLNEARMVEQAREEGRRLGFEEGIRRGREIGFEDGRNLGYEDGRADMRGIATEAVDRLMDDVEEPYDGEYEGGNAPPGTPPQIISTPEVVRAPSPANERGSTRSRMVSTSSSRRAQTPIPGPLPLSPPRAVAPSVAASSPRRPDIVLPPDNWIPTADATRFISVPPPHELQHTPVSPTTESIGSRPSGEQSPSVRARDFAFGNPDSSTRRRNSIDSQGSTNQSKASTALSQLDLVTPPHTTLGRNGNRRNLSVIPEDTSSHPSPNSSRARSIISDHRLSFQTHQTPDFAAAVGRTDNDRDMDSPTQLQEARLRDRRMNQRIADELRYSDPTQIEEWRRSGAQEPQSRASPDAPSRRYPSNVTVPSPLSPRGQDAFLSTDSPRRRRTRSMASTSSRSLNVPESRRNRQSTSSGSSIPEIIIEPPSRPPSDHIDHPTIGASGLLSPDHAHRPLPVDDRPPSAPPLAPTVPNSPVIPASYIYRNLPDNTLPPGFTPIGPPTNQLPQVASIGGPPTRHDTPPVPIPPPFSSSYSPKVVPSAVTLPAGAQDVYSSPSGRSRDLLSPIQGQNTLPFIPPRSASAMGEPSGSRTPRNNIYAAAPVPAGATYPQPLNTNASTPNGTALHVPLPASIDSQSSGHRRSVSLNDNYSPGSLGRAKSLPSRAVTPKPSNTSVGSGKSYSHYDPAAHHDPAYFGPDEYHRDPVTEANTLANANNASRPSTALSYLTIPGPS